MRWADARLINWWVVARVVLSICNGYGSRHIKSNAWPRFSVTLARLSYEPFSFDDRNDVSVLIWLFVLYYSNVVLAILEFLVDFLHFLLCGLQTRATHQFGALLLTLWLHQ